MGCYHGVHVSLLGVWLRDPVREEDTVFLASMTENFAAELESNRWADLLRRCLCAGVAWGIASPAQLRSQAAG